MNDNNQRSKEAGYFFWLIMSVGIIIIAILLVHLGSKSSFGLVQEVGSANPPAVVVTESNSGASESVLQTDQKFSAKETANVVTNSEVTTNNTFRPNFSGFKLGQK